MFLSLRPIYHNRVNLSTSKGTNFLPLSLTKFFNCVILALRKEENCKKIQLKDMSAMIEKQVDGKSIKLYAVKDLAKCAQLITGRVNNFDRFKFRYTIQELMKNGKIQNQSGYETFLFTWKEVEIIVNTFYEKLKFKVN